MSEPIKPKPNEFQFSLRTAVIMMFTMALFLWLNTVAELAVENTLFLRSEAVSLKGYGFPFFAYITTVTGRAEEVQRSLKPGWQPGGVIANLIVALFLLIIVLKIEEALFPRREDREARKP